LQAARKGRLFCLALTCGRAITIIRIGRIDAKLEAGFPSSLALGWMHFARLSNPTQINARNRFEYQKEMGKSGGKFTHPTTGTESANNR
jgi:hypothetical protein